MPVIGKDFLPVAKATAQIETASKKSEVSGPTEAGKAATEFEALLLHQMLKAMWATVPRDGILNGGREEEYYRDMLNEAMAKNIADGQGIGIKDVILRDINKLQEE